VWDEYGKLAREKKAHYPEEKTQTITYDVAKAIWGASMYRVLYKETTADLFYCTDRTPNDLEAALAVARRLLAEGKLEVAILDIKGKHILGETLLACCCGPTKISADLFSR
jgi:hypothetical protein